MPRLRVRTRPAADGGCGLARKRSHTPEAGAGPVDELMLLTPTATKRQRLSPLPEDSSEGLEDSSEKLASPVSSGSAVSSGGGARPALVPPPSPAIGRLFHSAVAAAAPAMLDVAATADKAQGCGAGGGKAATSRRLFADAGAAEAAPAAAFAAQVEATETFLSALEQQAGSGTGQVPVPNRLAFLCVLSVPRASCFFWCPVPKPSPCILLTLPACPPHGSADSRHVCCPVGL